MVDVVDSATRSRMMSGIKGKNTKPELQMRSALHKRGFRFRLHQEGLPGKPDLVLKKYRAIIFIHGCFWHGHSCRIFKWPATNVSFWETKIKRNQTKDKKVVTALKGEGWRVLLIWECAIKGKNKQNHFDRTVDQVCNWLLKSKNSFQEISGE